MCGVIFVYKAKSSQIIEEMKKNFRHRGPDDDQAIITQHEDSTYDIVYFTRLAIVDTSKHGLQPYEYKDLVYATNGEIYNYKDLEKECGPDEKSDCHVVGKIFWEQKLKTFEKLSGMWGSIIYNKKTREFVIGKDHLGIIPMYYGKNKDGSFYAASELKAIEQFAEEIFTLSPGSYIDQTCQETKWYNPSWHYPENGLPKNQPTFKEIHDELYQAVRNEMMGDVPFGILISGGVDSSVIAAIIMDMYRKGEINLEQRGMKNIHSFTVGLEGSPDVMYAKQVADTLGTVHHEISFTTKDALNSVKDVIFHTETFNETTIRASTPLYLMCKQIHELGIRVIYSGEGADELFGGYLYFHKAPNPQEMQEELVRKMNDLYKYDLLRTNKSCMGQSIEIRPPFLHKSFVEFVMNIDPSMKMVGSNELGIEKFILRKAFENYIPDQVLWRQKEQFSDGVGYDWVNDIKKKAENEVSDELFNKRYERFPVKTPTSKEMYIHRVVFEELFKNPSAINTVPYAKSVACSTEIALKWDASFQKQQDESGRSIIGVHQKSYKLNNAQQQLFN